MSMRQNGLVKGGTEACAIIGYGNRWYEPGQVRFMDDEPVRHKMLDLIVSSSKPHILLLSDLASTLDNVATGCTRCDPSQQLVMGYSLFVMVSSCL